MEVRDRKARKVSESLFEALGPGAYELHVLRGPRMARVSAFAEICFFPVIFRIAIGNSEALIEKSQIEKGKVLPLQ